MERKKSRNRNVPGISVNFEVALFASSLVAGVFGILPFTTRVGHLVFLLRELFFCPLHEARLH